jgi:tRNA 2-thiouridine synthesizing protein A
MTIEVLDAMGLKCPQPVLKIALKSRDMKSGDVLEVYGDCPTFEKDVRAWCQRMGRVLLSVSENGTYRKTIQIQF